MGAFTPKNRDNRLRCRVMGDGLFCPFNGNLAFNLAFHKIIHVAVLHFIALFTQAVDKPNHLFGIVHGLGIGHNQLPFLAAQTRGVLLGHRNQGSGSVRRGRLRHERVSIQKAVGPVPCLRLGNGVGLFCGFQKTGQRVAGQGFHRPIRYSMGSKDFLSSVHKGQVRVVKLASVQLLVVGAIQHVVISVFGCLDIQVIAAF